jgi:tetratricopeptide (TPR) repeat protein
VLLIAIGGALLLAFQLFGHGTPLYGAETDLLGDIIPAARSLRAGHIVAAHFEFKGPGYPLMLAAAGSLVGNDWLAARLLNVVSAVLGAWLSYRVATRFLSPGASLFVLCGLFLNPVWVMACIEAGTDMPAFALAMAATELALRARRAASWGTAGALAAAAILTRYNFVSLVPAAVATVWAAQPPDQSGPDPQPRVRRWLLALGPYLLGLALPLLAWEIVARIGAGGPLHNRNYLNLAFQIYGRGGSWDQFWVDTAPRFHSIIDVFTLDPARVVKTLAVTAALRWTDDIHELIPLSLGVAALLGIVAVWPRKKGMLPLVAHFVSAYLVLTTVFYNTRFFLYLVPFYLMAAASLIFEAFASRTAGRNRSGPTIPFAARAAIASILLATTGLMMGSEVRARLADTPYEVQAAAQTLRRVAPHGGRVMARKPHVAYFAGMNLVPLPQVDTFLDLFAAARASGAQYLFYSGLEASLRSQFWLLDIPGITIPGLEKIDDRTFTPRRYYTLYRFTSETTDSAALARTLLEKVSEVANAHPNDVQVQSQVGRMLLQTGRSVDALPYLTNAVRMNPADSRLLLTRAEAYFEAGDIASAAVDCERVVASHEKAEGAYRLLGMVRLAQGRTAEARAEWRQATEEQPANPDLFFELAVVERALGDSAASRQAFERCVVLAPGIASRWRDTLSSIPAGDSRAALVMLRRQGQGPLQ